MTDSVNRIAVVSNSFFGIGGAENSTQNLVRSLQEDGYSVKVLLPESERAQEIQEAGFDIEYFPTETLYISMRDIVLNRQEKVKLCEKLAAYDAVHFCMLHTVMALFPYFKHTNWVVTCRGGDIQNPRKTNYKEIVEQSPYGIAYKGYRVNLKNEIFLRLFILWYRKSGHFVSISEDMVSELRSLGVPAKRVHKILNGVDLQRFDRILSQTKVTKKDENCKYIYAVGRNDSRKGFYTLIDAARELKQRQISNMRFILKGRGFDHILEFLVKEGLESYFSIVDEGHNLDYQLETSFENDFQIPDIHTVALYKIADVVIIPSLIEALSNVGLEAETADKPLVVSDTFGCREYILRGSALGYETGNAADLIDKILYVLSNGDEVKRLEANRKTLRETNAKEIFLEKYKKIILGNK